MCKNIYIKTWTLLRLGAMPLLYEHYLIAEVLATRPNVSRKMMFVSFWSECFVTGRAREGTIPRFIAFNIFVEEQLETAVEGVASYSTNFSSLPPIGVKVGVVEFQQHVFATVPPATNDFDVLNVDDIRSKFCNGSPSKPVVIRQCTNKLPGIATPPAESLTSFRCVTEGIPGEVKINVCFSSIQEDEFTLEEFLEHNEDRSLEPEYHPMNVIDFNADSKSGMVHRFCLPNIVTDISFGHCMKNSLSPKNQLAFDFTSGISDYLLMSEAGSHTNWHQDFTHIRFLHFGKGSETLLCCGANRGKSKAF